MKKYFLKCGYFLVCFCLPLIVFANPKTDNERFYSFIASTFSSNTGAISFSTRCEFSDG